jgi:hypothetical protein
VLDPADNTESPRATQSPQPFGFAFIYETVGGGFAPRREQLGEQGEDGEGDGREEVGDHWFSVVVTNSEKKPSSSESVAIKLFTNRRLTGVAPGVPAPITNALLRATVAGLQTGVRPLKKIK